MKTTNLPLLLAAALVSGFSAFTHGQNATPQPTVVLDAEVAARLAASLANSEVKRRYDSAPFRADQGTPKFSDGRWTWDAIAGHGKADLSVKVSFTRTGADSQVNLTLLVSEAEPLDCDGRR